MTTTVLKSAAIWAAFIPIAIINGLIREKVLAPTLGSRLALPLSGLSCAALFFLLVYFSLPWLGPLTSRRCAVIGATWLVATVAFEFFFGSLVAGKPWRELLQAYDPTTGNLWLLVLLVIALSPVCVAALRGVGR